MGQRVSQDKQAIHGEDSTRLEVLRDLAHKALERQLANKQLRRLLVATDLAESDGTGAEAMRLLDTTGRGRGGGGLARCGLGGELLTRGLA